MNSYQKKITEDRRLNILRVLAQDPDYAVNHNLLLTAIAELNHKVDIDRLDADLDWLERQDLVECEYIGTTRTAKITRLGDSCANGTIKVTGIRVDTWKD